MSKFHIHQVCIAYHLLGPYVSSEMKNRNQELGGQNRDYRCEFLAQNMGEFGYQSDDIWSSRYVLTKSFLPTLLQH